MSQSLGFVNVIIPGFSTEIIRYDKFVEKLFKVDTHKEMVHHAKGGCCEEAGELSDVLKRIVTYGNPLMSLDKDGQTMYARILEELGDLKFYMQAVMNIYNISEQDVLQFNAQKLTVRYNKLVYSDADALSRADKLPGE